MCEQKGGKTCIPGSTNESCFRLDSFYPRNEERSHFFVEDEESLSVVVRCVTGDGSTFPPRAIGHPLTNQQSPQDPDLTHHVNYSTMVEVTLFNICELPQDSE